MNAHWEGESERWVLWARTPGHDAYWSYREAFFGLVPAPAGRTLDVGCGEGRVARDLAARGHSVVGVDASPTLVRHAGEADRRGVYLVADAAALPFPDASFGLVVAHNSLMDVDDLDAAVAEAARVLAPAGRLCIAVTHPINDAGRFDGEDAGAPYVIPGSYFGRRPFHARAEHDGLRMAFAGWSQSLEVYGRAFEAAGLLIEALREPVPSAATGRYLLWMRIPLFLHLRCRRA